MIGVNRHWSAGVKCASGHFAGGSRSVGPIRSLVGDRGSLIRISLDSVRAIGSIDSTSSIRFTSSSRKCQAAAAEVAGEEGAAGAEAEAAAAAETNVAFTWAICRQTFARKTFRISSTNLAKWRSSTWRTDADPHSRSSSSKTPGD